MPADLRAAEYQNALQACILAARLLDGHDLPEFLRAIDHADAVGPILDPRLWMAKERDMHWNKEVFEAAMPLWRLAKKLGEVRDAG